MDKNVNETGVLLSIIIPVFNAEKYLGYCLDSLLEQDTDIEYELICVNEQKVHVLSRLDYKDRVDDGSLRHLRRTVIQIAKSSVAEKYYVSR